MRRRVARNTHVGSSKVKVVLRGQMPIVGIIQLVRTITSLCKDGFKNYLAEICTYMRQRVACKTRVGSLKVKVVLKEYMPNIGIIQLVQTVTSLYKDGF